MAVYNIEVTTGERLFAGTSDYVYITLIGAEGESERTLLDEWGNDFAKGTTGSYSVKTPRTLGELFLLKVEKDPVLLLAENLWFCSKIVVTTPEEEVILFPCHRWMSRGELVELRGGPEYVIEHWKDDDFYGFQFFNAVNPNIIHRCSQLPHNFPVTEDMVKPFLQEASSLHAEMKLQQQPSGENPIFLPSDTETDWLLAKMFIRNADSMQHQSVHHLMNAHFLVQGFALATLRNLPLIHPLYKSSLGVAGSLKLMARAHSQTTYSSLCLPENITERGLESVPNFYYRDDGLKLWSLINSFVKEMADKYYPSDNDVSRDSELQAWISDIFTNTFLENGSSGIPQDFRTVEELTKFVTMVIFTASAQHAAVHNGQVPLGSYPSEHFGEPDCKQIIKAFQGDLSYLSEEIAKRNSELTLPYEYLNPAQIENSIGA
ncbi:Arachidonate 12-lipoxygenase, 12R-type [Merluccius polli]|uniref:Arachidonate 12-lipoxygenase, 12R-type n=1 Tax=Merluccius polli TaxID=89951 RepID=A0AA47M496_MERPO|nr:Arachidonate 12-lipoxygenase, 12R-type [Merluccius polli]